MSHVAEEITSQPACWRRAAAEARPVAEPGESVAVVGCGTSWFMAMAFAALREAAGHGRTDAFAASEFPAGRDYDRVVAITRSGTTTEVLDLLATTGATVLTANPDLAGNTVLLDYADEESVVQTRFATTALAYLRACIGEDLTAAVADAERALTVDLGDLVAAEQVTFLGRGWTVGLAHEAALKLREAASAWTEAYPAMEYRHGPISVAEPGRVTWVFGPAPAGLADDVAATGATWVDSDLDPMAHLVVAQRLAVAVALRRGLDPDRPRHLTRSVVLPPCR
ncbi:sugar isomerase [Actinokineospora sp. PR83]|uniref:SIS domain-containing protein n=1 Tax=Actinokineospora sp. PR83 TaxID=2884908 RepID=UPI0027E1ADA6|nr:sugar isomerase [Actinokineospora sp. PR83]MCG8920097.1 sugar isomerase [Actinokineospora sp. PR83]